MRFGSVLLIIWLIAGATAAGQRHFYNGPAMSCVKARMIMLTVSVGPLNYLGVNPQISCQARQPGSSSRDAVLLADGS